MKGDPVKTWGDEVPEDHLDKILGGSECFGEVDSFEGLEGKTVSDVLLHGGGDIPEGGVRISYYSTSTVMAETSASGTYLPVDSGSADGAWDFTDDSALVCDVEDCGNYTWLVMLMPSNEQVGGRTVGEWCGEMEPVTLEITAGEPDSATSSSSSGCSPGSGRFQLLPVGVWDNNYDTNGRTTYLPVQKTGTGALTNRARVTQITKVLDGGYALRVLKANARATYSPSDLLQSPSSVSYAITGSHNFSAGQILGMPKFLHPPHPMYSTIDAQVDMTWSCSTASNVRTEAQGYTFATSTLGCPGVQKLTFRPTSTAITWELYGNSAYSKETPRAPDGSFSYNESGLSVAGKVTSWSSNSATLVLTSATFGGVSQCTPGTYTIGAEN